MSSQPRVYAATRATDQGSITNRVRIVMEVFVPGSGDLHATWTRPDKFFSCLPPPSSSQYHHTEFAAVSPGRASRTRMVFSFGALAQ